MKRQSSKSSSKSSSKKVKSKKVNFSFNPKNFDILNIKWKSPNDGKENEFNINVDPRKFNTIEIKDNH